MDNEDGVMCVGRGTGDVTVLLVTESCKAHFSRCDDWALSPQPGRWLYLAASWRTNPSLGTVCNAIESLLVATVTEHQNALMAVLAFRCS